MGVFNGDNFLKVEWPDYGYIFNPIPVRMYAYEDVALRVVVDPQQPPPPTPTWPEYIDVTLDKPLLKTNPNPGDPYREGVLDLSGALQAMFDRDLLNVQQIDNVLLRVVRLDIYLLRPDVEPEFLTTTSIQAVWGATQVGDYNTFEDSVFSPGIGNISKYKYFKGLPFTVPLQILPSVTEPVYWYQRIDEGQYESRGQLTTGKYNLLINSAASLAQRRIVFRFDKKPIADWDGIYTAEFDHTFRGGDEGSHIAIIDVAECTREGMYLRWIGPLGEWYYYNFDIVQRTTTSGNSEINVEPLYWETTYDLANGHPGTRHPIGKTGQERVQLNANLIDQQTYEYVRTILTSPIVMLYASDNGQERWTRINVATGTFNRSLAVTQDLSFSVDLPQMQLQYQ